ncbi:hypothetical protein Mp_2g12200 [Marchantia polymorpha subsp. ruderalis]|uniref:Uncharacterized protein n=1 Tax=Marchantia polymorpha TaxID=3197 RepID=A0A2R6VYG7_MARPO|nr:hypothetical protein MARPO_0661s0001 [Marchantia polymorpha]BBN02030.1 hypothetical protein Mp_2g12200 [Marchantia polymorpha subsp. ruderalis]|eukprot:PTQ26653.1 hypothetical protein MARPO_0661s0001 [Marchantia polymorpha]
MIPLPHRKIDYRLFLCNKFVNTRYNGSTKVHNGQWYTYLNKISNITTTYQSYFPLDSHDSVILYVHFYCRFEDKNLSGWRHAQQTSRSRQIATSWYPLRTPVAHIQRDLLAFTNSAIQLSVRIANEEFPTALSSLMSPEIDSMATSCHSIPVASWETRCSALIELRNQHCSSRR